MKIAMKMSMEEEAKRKSSMGTPNVSKDEM
jgi:hypothetical protein